MRKKMSAAERIVRREKMKAKRIALQQEQFKESIAFVQKYAIPSISLLIIGLFFISVHFILPLFAGEIESGKVDDISNIIGPIEIESDKQLITLKCNKRIVVPWYQVSMLLLDSSKNYLVAGSKFLFYESDSDGTYTDYDGELSVVIREKGTYFFQVISQYPPTAVTKTVNYKIVNQSFGRNYFFEIGIFFLAIGGFCCLWVHNFYAECQTKPTLTPENIRILGGISLLFAILLIVTIFTSISFGGYAGRNNYFDTPSSFFDNNNTTYFGFGK